MAQKDDSFKLQQFGGCLPAWDDHLLPEGQAAMSINGYLFSGALESWRVPKLLRNTTKASPGYIYRLTATPEAVASATLNFSGNPAEGDTVTLSEEVYTFTATVNAAYKILIGGDAAASAANLLAAFTHDNGAGTNAGTLYGTGTVANPAIDQAHPENNTIGTTPTVRVTVVSPDPGAAFNSTAVGATGAALSWVDAGGNPTTTFRGGANVSIDTRITAPSVFLEYDDPNTDVVRSPVVDDQYDRYYVASSSLAPRYNTRARIEAGQAPWLLGVPPPGCTPTVAVDGGGSDAQLGFVTSSTGTTGAPGANTIYMIPITPTGAMILNDVSVVVRATNPTARVAAVLYDDLDGSPHTLLNTGTVVTGVTDGGTVVSAFVNPTGLLMNVRYWIGIMTDTAIDFQFANTTGSSGVVSLNTFNNGPPAAIQNLNTGFGELQMWGNLTTSSVLSARSYVYTYVTEYGEESAPSPATVLTGWSNGTWTIGLFQPPPDQLGVTRNIKKIFLYRTITAQSGSTTYYFVAEMPVTQATYTDTIGDDVIVANNQLQSQLWTPPPESLQGIVVMPNGILAGWKGNEIWFSEPYRPHAWPPSYVLTTEYPIVGLGVTGNSVVAATTGAPYVASGTAPGSMTAIKIQNSEPCHSRKSVLGNSDGVYYASPNGLIMVTQYGQVSNATQAWITREKWQKLTPQANVAAVFLTSQYFAWEIAPNGSEGGLGNRGFTVELGKADTESFTIWPQPGGHRLGLQLLSNPLANGMAMVQIDPWSAVCFVISRNGMFYYDFSDQAPAKTVLDWTSKLFQQRAKKNFEAMRISFTVPPNTPALNATRLEADTNDPVWLQPLPNDRYGYILVYAGGKLVTAREIRKTQEVLRIVSGFKYETWQWRVVTRLVIATIQVGTSVKGMANV